MIWIAHSIFLAALGFSAVLMMFKKESWSIIVGLRIWGLLCGVLLALPLRPNFSIVFVSVFSLGLLGLGLARITKGNNS